MSEYIKGLPRPITIVGMGKSGTAARRLLLATGVPSDEIFTFDERQSAQFNDPHKLMTEATPQTLVVSPGVPLAVEWIRDLRQKGVRITSELSLACSALGKENLIGVTGSVGKSTTVSILGAGARAFSPDSFVGGNLGFPLADYVADVLEKKRPPAEWVILELSSYQLENCELLQLDFSALTYFTANHLERYPSLLDYYETKWRIVALTRNQVILNRHGGDLADFFQGKDSSRICWADRDSAEMKSLHLEESRLIGVHNLDNLAVACTLARQAAWPSEAFAAMRAFGGLAHRLENLGERKGVRFINDSKATAMDSVGIAVEAASASRRAGGRLYVLLGGRDKNLPWERLHSLGVTPNAEFVFFGECRELAQRKSGLAGASFPRLQEALDFCFDRLKPGDSLLLSPGGTSLDEFRNFEERGDFFREQVEFFAGK